MIPNSTDISKYDKSNENNFLSYQGALTYEIVIINN